MNEKNLKTLKWIAIGILVGCLAPYLLAYLKSKQEAQTQSQELSN
jgi:hypothetical protein